MYWRSLKFRKPQEHREFPVRATEADMSEVESFADVVSPFDYEGAGAFWTWDASRMLGTKTGNFSDDAGSLEEAGLIDDVHGHAIQNAALLKSPHSGQVRR